MIGGGSSIYSDLVSVMSSQLKYGRATSPSFIKRHGLRAQVNRSLIGFVPTVEQLNAKSRRSR
jgi:hypothetical protein